MMLLVSISKSSFSLKGCEERYTRKCLFDKMKAVYICTCKLISLFFSVYVVNAINRHPSSPYVQNQVIPPPAQNTNWIPTSRAEVPVSVRDKQLVLPFKSTLPYNLEAEGAGIKVILGASKWRKLKREVESIGGYNEQLDCCYTHSLGRCCMYACFPCFYCCLYKHNEEYTSQVYMHWRDEFEAKKIKFCIYYSPGSLWDAFIEDDFELAPATHCFCIDLSSSYVQGIYAKQRSM